MRSLTTYLSVLLAAAGATDAIALDDAQQQLLIETHNRWRAEVGVGPVGWQSDLAIGAQAWADHLAQSNRCHMRHSTPKERGNTGENLYWASALVWSDGRRETQNIHSDKVVDSWGSEIADYDFSNNRCAPGKVCGHYTQVVWKSTRDIGCGMAQCGDASQVWVCRYSPPGNWVGQRPY